VIADSDSGSTRKSTSAFYFISGTGNDNQPPESFNLISPNNDIIPTDSVVSFFWKEPQDMDGYWTKYILFYRQDSFPEFPRFGVLENGRNNGNVSIHHSNVTMTSFLACSCRGYDWKHNMEQ